MTDNATRWRQSPEPLGGVFCRARDEYTSYWKRVPRGKTLRDLCTEFSSGYDHCACGQVYATA